MSRFDPWNQHPRACVLIIGQDFSQMLEGDRVKAAMAAILANVWIFNAAVRARKEIKMGGHFYSNVLVVPHRISHIPGTYVASPQLPGHINARCVTISICCHSCGQGNVGLLDGLCFNCRPK